MITMILTVDQHNKVLKALAHALVDAEAAKTIMESPAAKQVCEEQKALVIEMEELLRRCPGHELKALLMDYQAMCERLNTELYRHAGDTEELDRALHTLKKRASKLLPDKPCFAGSQDDE